MVESRSSCCSGSSAYFEVVIEVQTMIDYVEVVVVLAYAFLSFSKLGVTKDTQVEWRRFALLVIDVSE